MEQYIPKSVVLAEIEKLMGNPELIEDWRYRVKMEEKNELLKSIINTINTLEVKELPIWEKVSSDTGQTTLYEDEGKSYLERFGYRIDLKDLDKLPKKNLKAQKGEI